MTMKPMGPAAIMARMQELQGTVSPVNGPPPKFEIPGSAKPGQPLGLSGEITEDGVKPMSPFGPGFSVQSSLTKEQLMPALQRAASENGVDPALLESIIQTESNFNPLAVSNKGAIGLSQLMPDTAKGLGVTDPYDPVQNLKGGAKYLSSMLKQFGGDINLAVAAYNAGPGNVNKAGGIPNFPETQNYVKRVMSLYQSKVGK